MKPAIVMQSDFTKGVATCTMDGVIACVDPEIRTYDCCHTIPPFDTYAASCALNYIIDFWPKGTIFVSVVDPGVGTDRKACIAKLRNGCYVVTPDNGTLTHVKNRIGIEEVRIIDETKNRLQITREVSIFHGRDLFAYCAAKLASGMIDYAGVGPVYSTDEIVVHKTVLPKVENDILSGMIETSTRGFGLVDTNIPYKMFEQIHVSQGDRVLCKVLHKGKEIFSEVISYVPSFGFVPEGDVLVMVSETKHLQIAENLGDISTRYNIGTGPDWKIQFRKEEG